jgi:hypothetical protein
MLAVVFQVFLKTVVCQMDIVILFVSCVFITAGPKIAFSVEIYFEFIVYDNPNSDIEFPFFV